MDMEKSIADVAFLEELYALPDERPTLTLSGREDTPNRDELDGKYLWLSLRNHLQRLWVVWRYRR
jgi:hypothetical protein